MSWYLGDSKADATREFLLKRSGVTVSVAQHPVERADMFATGDGGVVWEAAEATLAHLDEQFSDNGLSGLSVLELGAGTGVCGLACAALGASIVFLTDLPNAQPLLRTNAERSNPGSEHVATGCITWGEPIPNSIANENYDLVLCCDCLYQPAQYQALAKTIAALDAKTTILTWQPRAKGEEGFLELMRELGFVCKPMPSALHPEVCIVHLSRAPNAMVDLGAPYDQALALLRRLDDEQPGQDRRADRGAGRTSCTGG